MSTLEFAYWLALDLVFMISAGAWVLFGLGRLSHFASEWHFDSSAVTEAGIPLVVLAVAINILLVGWYRCEALGPWRVWGSGLVLASLIFVAVLLVTKGTSTPFAGPLSEYQIGEFIFSGEVILGIVAASLGVTYLVRRSRDAVVATWLASGTLVALVGWWTWVNWIPYRMP